MSDPAVDVIKGWLNMSSNDRNSQEGAMESYPEKSNHLLRCHATDPVIAEAYENI